MIPLVGFLPADDPRVAGTVDAIERELMHDGFVRRYAVGRTGVDGLPPGEGAFLPCSFWLADNLALLGRADEARDAVRPPARAAQRRRAARRRSTTRRPGACSATSRRRSPTSRW